MIRGMLTGLGTTGLQTHVVGHDLSPLHVGQGELWIGHILIAEDNKRDETGVG